jgi:hypothetical protein
MVLAEIISLNILSIHLKIIIARFYFHHFMRLLIFISMLFATFIAMAAQPWQPLFNGKDLSGWDTEMMNLPDPTWEVPGLARGTSGVYLEALGKNCDPLHVFTVTNLGGEPTIHVSGQGFGVMMTTATFTNVHLRLQIKWGDRKWSKKIGKPFDTGLLYFCHSEAGLADKTWPRSFEFQICQNEFGDLYSLASQITVPARRDGNLWRYDPAGTNTFFLQKHPVGNHCAHAIDAEKPKGEWNTLDLITFNGDSIHVVNGQVVMRLHDAQRLDGGTPAPITSGKICLQTEGGECFFRNVEVQPIMEIPAEFAGH